MPHFLTSRLWDLMLEEINVVSALKEEVERLDDILNMTQALLKQGGEGQGRIVSVRPLLENIEDLVYEAECLLNKFAYGTLREWELLEKFAYETVREKVEFSNQFKRKASLCWLYKRKNESLKYLCEKPEEKKYMGVQMPQFVFIRNLPSICELSHYFPVTYERSRTFNRYDRTFHTEFDERLGRLLKECKISRLEKLQVYGAPNLEMDLLSTNKTVSYYRNIINGKDCHGNMILQVETTSKQPQESRPIHVWTQKGANNYNEFTLAWTVNVPLSGMKGIKTEKFVGSTGFLRGGLTVQKKVDKSNDEVRIDLGKYQPLRFQNDKEHHLQSHFHAVMPESLISWYYTALIVATLLASMTFHLALKPPAALTVSLLHHESYQNHLFILFNSIAFFTSLAFITIVTHELPLKPWLPIAVCSAIGAYMCAIRINSPHEQLMVLLIGSSILLAALLKYLALDKMLLNIFQQMRTRIHLRFT